MAIEKHNFDVSSTAANIEDVTAWLNENAGEYFSSVTCDVSSKTITCRTGTRASLSFIVDHNNSSIASLMIELENGADNNSAHGTGSRQGAQSKNGKVIRAVITSTGIVLEFESSSNIIYITKSNLGTTSVFITWYGLYINNQHAYTEIYESCDLINSTEVFGSNYVAGDHTSNVLNSILSGRYFWSKNKPTGLTVLVPYCFLGDTYAPDMYLTPFSQYPGQKGILSCGGVNYYYNGYVALKE